MARSPYSPSNARLSTLKIVHMIALRQQPQCNTVCGTYHAVYTTYKPMHTGTCMAYPDTVDAHMHPILRRVCGKNRVVIIFKTWYMYIALK